MTKVYSKKFTAILVLFFCATTLCLADDEDPKDSLTPKAPGSLGLEADFAKNYLSLQATASMAVHSDDVSSLDIHYDNTRSGGDDPVKSWEAGLSASNEGKTFNGSLGASYGADDLNRKSLGAKLSFGATLEYADGYDIALTLSGGPTRLSAAEASTITAGVLKKRSATINSTVTITQWSPSAELSLTFLDGFLGIWGSGTRFRYQDYSAGSGLAGSPERSAAAAGLKDTLVGGFIDWEWSAGASLHFPWEITLSGSYCESLDLDSQTWSKSVSGKLSKDFGKRFDALAGLTHATEGGSGDNTLKAGINYNF